MTDRHLHERPASRPGLGVLISVVGVAVLTAFAAWAPVGFRKLLLFAVGYGLCSGGIVIWAAREFGIARRSSLIATLLLVVAGLMAIAAHGHHQLRRERSAAAARAEAEQKMAQSILDAAAESDPALAAKLNEGRRERDPSFVDYLALRVRPLGEWRQPWPFVFWGAEVFAASAAGVLLVSRMLHTPRDADDVHR